MFKIRILVLALLLSVFSTSALVGEVSSIQIEPKVETRELDSRAKILSEYFRNYNSPFQYHAQDFIDAADEYNLDWKLVPAISGVESTFGKNSYGYNAWGWGIYGDNRVGFDSWKHGIYTVTGGLKKNYIDRGLTNPYSMNRVYAASKTWGWRVDYFMKDMEQFEAKSKPQAQIFLNPLRKTAGASAQLAYKI